MLFHLLDNGGAVAIARMLPESVKLFRTIF
jgi:hypothetical protein